MDDSYNPTDEQLRTWYEHTTYKVFSPELVLRIGLKNKGLDKLLIQSNSTTYAYLTAWNPQSKRSDQEINIQQQRRLIQNLDQGGYRYYYGAGTADDGQWPPEPSVLILQISKTEAIELGKKYNQKAIVFGRIQEPPELVFLEY